VETPALELFPTAQKPARGTIMVCPGGGYGILAINHEGYFVAKKLNEFGWDVAILLYHVSAGKETRELAIADAQAALTLLQKRGGEFGLGTTKIGVMGFSAGGHLAARLTHATAAGTPPDFAVLMYPAYLEQGGKVLEEVAPVKTPAFVYVAGDDKYAPSAIARKPRSRATLPRPRTAATGLASSRCCPRTSKTGPTSCTPSSMV